MSKGTCNSALYLVKGLPDQKPTVRMGWKLQVGAVCRGALQLTALVAFRHSGQDRHHAFTSLVTPGQVNIRLSIPSVFLAEKCPPV